MKKIGLIGLAALLVFALIFTACGNKGSGDPTSAACTDHVWGDWKVFTAAGFHHAHNDICSNGTEVATCTRCGTTSAPRIIPCLGTADIVVDGAGAITGSYKDLNVTYLCIPPNAKSIGEEAFYENQHIQNVQGGANINEIGVRAFDHCILLLDISIQKVTTIGNNAFFCCFNMSSVSFPKITSIGDSAFENCYYLKSADFPELTSISNRAFFGCTSLESVYLPMATTIGNRAFADNDSLEDVTLGAAAPITGPGSGTMGFSEELVAAYTGPGRYTRVGAVWTKQ